MDRVLFRNVMLFDGTGSDLRPAEVLVEGNRIATVAGQGEAIPAQGATIVDGGGATLMPGLTEAHGHITYFDMPRLRDLGDKPVEEHMLTTVYNAKLMLDLGFTSIYSAASSKPRLEVVLRNEINAGRIPGPRMRAASPEITSTGGLGDDRQLHMHHTGIEIIADGPDEVRRAVRTMIREGVDTIKVNISGDNYVRKGFAEACSYTDEEVGAAAVEAHARGCWLACHARADESVRMALKHDFRVIYHCDFVTPETIDLLEAKKDRIFLAPAIGLAWNTAYEAEAFGITRQVAEDSGIIRTIERSATAYTEIRKRGIRVLPGGDYGFAWIPMGTNARDLEHFVNLYGYTPAEVLMAATRWGGEIMGMGEELGLVRPGYLADLLLLDGNPLQDLKLFLDKANFLAIMKDGRFHKAPLPRGSAEIRRAAE
jgi:imidazolonepropionase-like amidohydrolase